MLPNTVGGRIRVSAGAPGAGLVGVRCGGGVEAKRQVVSVERPEQVNGAWRDHAGHHGRVVLDN